VSSVLCHVQQPGVLDGVRFVLQCVLQCVAMRCSVLQCVAVFDSVFGVVGGDWGEFVVLYTAVW